ncbi:AlbA family DNA-binding domain-containing protein [Acinetobacter defluvii]|uniref:AlbA family DNA-binding domain-containing protein n=1 Tax=Acinetobacter defluvii TaxID=1871111 RepID=UPI001E41BA89|nr:ATP-binding protein [Acinetobacter defluvii]
MSLDILAFTKNPMNYIKKIERIKETFNKISIPIHSHEIYTEILRILNQSFDFLADINVATEHKIKLIYQWQNIQNLETVTAYKSLEKIKNILRNYQQKSSIDYYLNLIRLGENQRVEFKERTTDLLTNRKSDKWVKACFAFMNTRNGYVFIGVSDDLKIVGIEQEMKDFYNNSLDLMKRSLIDKLAHESHKISNIYSTLEDIKIYGKTILVFKCNKADRPLYYKGELFMRTNGQTTRVPPELVASFREEFYC